MTAAVEHLKAEAETLSPAEREELAYHLLASITPDPVGTNDEWRAEIARRVADIRAGRVVGRPVEEFLAELRERYP